MRGTALLLLCAITLAQAAQPQLTLTGKVCNCNAAEAPKVCSQYGSDNELIAHENCNQFYKCTHGKPIPYYCPSITLYNPLAEICDWPENVQCGDRPIVAPGDGAEGEDCSQEDSNTDNEGNGGQDNGGSDNGGGGTCNCNPEEAPALCAADGSDGKLVAHQNCNQFYKCDNGVPVTLNCPPGLLYNPYTEKCDWPDSVECGNRPIVEIDGGEDSGNGNGEDGSGEGNGDNGGTCNCNPGEAPGICAADGSDGVLVAHENCNQFYKCSHGVPVALNCPAGLLYNPYTEQCDWPHNVDCGDRPIVEIEGGGDNDGDVDSEDSSNGNGESDNGGGNGDNGGSDNGGTCNCNPGEAPGICAADGSDGVLVAHENCNQFYKCSHGVPVALYCPAGLLYKPQTEQCDWPYNVDCGDRPIVEIEGGGDNDGDVDSEDSSNGNGESDNGGGNGDNGGSDNGGTCNCNPGEAPELCAADGSDGTLVAHENCNQFYKCAHGIPVTISCPPGLVYNPYIECCDWPVNVDCGDKPIVEVEGGGGNEDNGSGGGNGDNGSGGGSIGGNSNEDNGGTCNCNPGEAPGICAADGSDGVLIAHENCNQFYKCSHGVPVALYCPAGLLYKPQTEQCDWPHNVDCGDRPIVEIEGGGDNDGDVDSEDSSNGNGESDNGGGNGDNGGSDNGGTCNCNPGEAPGICAADGSDGVLVAHENCNQFYKCSHGVPVALYCPAGLLYKPQTEQCDWPHNVDCGDRPIVEIEGGGDNDGDVDSEDSSNGNGESDNGGGNGDNGDSDNGSTCNCNPGEAPGICAADGSDGVLVAHENCNQFYKCSYGVPVALDCPAGLLYKPQTEQCDWPHNVDCGDRPIVEIEGGGDNDGDVDSEDSSNGNGESDNGGGNGDNGGSDNGGTCNCNPGEAPGICAADGSDGVLVAHENCNQFYKCSHGVPVALYCPAGLLYKPQTEQCDWPHNVDCGDRPIVEIEGGGDNDGDVDSEDSSNGNGESDNGGGNGDNGGSDNGSTCNCNPGEAPGICAADGSDGVLVAHENCNQFYKCSYGVPVALDCPAGLLYKPQTEQCDWPYNVDCGDRPIVEIEGGGDNDGDVDSDNGGGNGDNGGSDNGGTCNCNPGEAPGICAADGSDGVLVAHENCNQFYKCSYGVPVALDCPAGLLYKPQTEQCDWPHNVDCGDRPIVEVEEEGDTDNNDTDDESTDNGGTDNGGTDNGGTDNGGTDNGGTDNGGTDNGGTDNGGTDNGGTDNGGADNGGTDNGGSDNESGGSCNCNPEEAAGICAAAGSEGQFVAHENCNQFYQCAHGIPVCKFCPGNLLYNPYAQRCDWPHLVDCGERPIVENEGEGEDNGNTDDSSEESDNENDGGDNEITCNCNPDEAPSICNAAGSDGTQVAHVNCNQFYKCAHGVPVAIFCSGNLLYNPYTQRCDWPSHVECGDRPIVEVEGGGEDNGDGDNGDGDSGGEINCDPSQAPEICAAAGSDGILVAHENCDQFYVCTHGEPLALECPSNLLYNPNIKDCDWPQNVDCGDRVIPEPDSGDIDAPCACNAREAPSICAVKESNGKLIAHENCSQYYVCFEGTPVARSCPLSLFYDPHTEQCLWPASVSCEGRHVTSYSSLNKHMQARRGVF